MDMSLINIWEGIMKEVLAMSTKEAAKVASENELTNTSDDVVTCQTVLTSKASPHIQVIFFSSNEKTMLV